MNRCLIGDCRELLPTLPDELVHCVVTSPPYWGLRDYGVAGQLGLESTPQEYVENMVAVFREVRRVLRDDGTLWLNLGDSYASDNKGSGGPSEKQLSNAGSRYGTRAFEHGLKPKDLVGIPWRVAFALQADGWYLRQDIIWSKPNPMPESVRDRCTKAHEYLFLLAKSERYYFDADAISEPASGWNGSTFDGGSGNKKRRDATERGCPESGVDGSIPWEGDSRNKRSVWTVTTQSFKEAHFATFPPALIEPCVLSGCPAGGVVLDPFIGSGTVAQVAQDLGRQWIGIELNPEYARMVEMRSAQQGMVFTT